MDDTGGRVRVERSAKRVRAFAEGVAVADTTAPYLVWEVRYFPTYYLPAGDVRTDLLVDTGRTSSRPGPASLFDVRLPSGRVLPDAAARFPDSPVEELRDTVRLDWSSMDHWFEEDEEVIGHARNPYTRVDVLASSRHVVVEIDGVVVADSRSPRILFETGLPPRYYLPLVDVRMDLLRPSDTRSVCPYKGTASYWSVEVDGTWHEDVVWTYAAPLPESQKIAGLVCFYDERVDVRIDGMAQPRPRTPFA